MSNTTTNAVRPTAEALNSHLAAGGAVQVTTYTRSTVYTSKHVGWFSERGGDLYVKQGRGVVCLAVYDRLLVGIRLGRPAK